jgi:hypothetical protein
LSLSAGWGESSLPPVLPPVSSTFGSIIPMEVGPVD